MTGLQSVPPIAVVDDSEDDLLFVRRLFERAPFKNQILTFSNGQSFIEYMNQVEERPELMPALVLLDLNMPKLNGFEVIWSLKTKKTFARLPVILVFTNSDDPVDRKRALDSGVDGFLGKEILVEDSLKFISDLVSLCSRIEIEGDYIRIANSGRHLNDKKKPGN